MTKARWMRLQAMTPVLERSARTTWAVRLPRIDRRSTSHDLSGSSRLLGGGETFVSVVRGMGDEELVDRVAEGDDRALSELYDRYARQVYVTGIRLLKDSHLAEELVQDAFTNVWRGAGSFDRGRASFATWLYRITRNRATDLERLRWPGPRGKRSSLGHGPGALPHFRRAPRGSDLSVLRGPVPARNLPPYRLTLGDDQEPDHGRLEETSPRHGRRHSGGGST